MQLTSARWTLVNATAFGERHVLLHNPPPTTSNGPAPQQRAGDPGDQQALRWPAQTIIFGRPPDDGDSAHVPT
ncbi:MAG: hypothetical protein R2838_03320 [Caldilineaceae bacterium]